MPCTPTPLASCSLSWDDPATTVPPGRLQGHFVIDQLGGLAVRCPAIESPILGPDGQPLRGIGLNVAEHATDQESPDGDPPDGYVNPIRFTQDGEVWIQPAAPVFEPHYTRRLVPGRNMVGPGDGNRTDLDTAVTLCTRNTTNDTCYVRRKVSVVSWSMDDPPAPTVPTIPIEFTSLLDDQAVTTELDNRTVGADPLQVLDGTGHGTVNNRQSTGTLHFPPGITDRYNRAKINYWLDINGGRILVGMVRTGGGCGGSMTFDLPDQSIAPDECWCDEITPHLQAIIPAGTDPWTIFPGEIIISHQLIAPPPGLTFTTTETCTP